MGLEFKNDPETNLNPRYTLNSYVVGPSNELAVAAATAITEKIGKYNPFFVYGGVGLGKTHLIQAVGNEIVARYQKRSGRNMSRRNNSLGTLFGVSATTASKA